MILKKRLLLGLSMLSLVIVAGCNGFGKEVGDPWADVTEPNWVEHISPMMEAYCNECHGETGTQGAPSSFRLDIYESIDEPGAYEKRDRSLDRILDSTAPMPPMSYAHQPVPSVGPVFQMWVDNGAPFDASSTTETGSVDTATDDTGNSSSSGTTDSGTTGTATDGE